MIRSRRLAETVERWQGMRVLVLGDALLDEWRHGEPDRLCREAPVPVVSVRETAHAAGGAANTAVNIAALGGHAVLVASVGDDPEGVRLQRCLADSGVDLRPVVVPGWRTPVKRRVVAGDQLVVRLDEGRRGALPEGAERALLALAEEALRPPPSAVVICDYGYGALGAPARRWLRERRDRLPVVAVDAHELAHWAQVRPSLVTPDYAEALDLLGADPPTGPADPKSGDLPTAPADRKSYVVAHAAELLDRTRAGLVAVTLDTDGAVAVEPDAPPVYTSARAAPASHAVGSGDTYLAGFTLAVAAGAGLPGAARLAQLAAASAIRGPRTCVAGRAALLTEAPAPGTDLAVSEAELAAAVGAERARGGRIVFTNGCFDVLHRGHIGFLTQARSLGDLLVVAVNSDAGVRRLKGPDRPVNHVEDRVAVLAALSCVDHVVVFDEDSPAPLIERLRPDVYAKGGDYRADLLPEAALVERLGGQVRILDYVPDRSTSAVIERIRSRRSMIRASPTS